MEKETVLKPSKDFIKARFNLIKSMDSAIKELSKTCENSHVELLNSLVKTIKTNKNRQFVAIDEGIAISYARDIKYPFDRSKRIITTLGRYVRRNLNIDAKEIEDKVLDAFTNKIYALSELSKFNAEDYKILTGKDIQEFYKHDKNNDSCMVGAASWRVELYTLNPDKISLIVYKNKSRALLWKADCGMTFMDKCYGNHKDNQVLTTWAKIQGYEILNSYNYDKYKTVMVSDLNCGKYLPSIDSFYWLKHNPEKKLITAATRYFENAFQTYYEKAYVVDSETKVCKSCGLKCPDEKEFKIDDLNFCYVCFAKLKKCQVCGNKSYKFSLKHDMCVTCEKSFIKKCQNIKCKKLFNKTDMIKMRKINSIKICYACCETCMKVINPEWIKEGII